MMYRPLSDNMIIEAIKDEKSLIVVPENVDTTQDGSQIFEVKAIGPGYQLESGQMIAPDVQVGDKVFVSAYAPLTLKHNGAELILARGRDVVLVLEEELTEPKLVEEGGGTDAGN